MEKRVRWVSSHQGPRRLPRLVISRYYLRRLLPWSLHNVRWTQEVPVIITSSLTTPEVSLDKQAQLPLRWIEVSVDLVAHPEPRS